MGMGYNILLDETNSLLTNPAGIHAFLGMDLAQCQHSWSYSVCLIIYATSATISGTKFGPETHIT